MNQLIRHSELEVIDIAHWYPDEFGVYSEGARDKTAFFPRESGAYPFIKPERRYLFKLSDKRYPEQFWGEIIAAEIGEMIGVSVPPAFPAINSATKKSGALIEWFYEDEECTFVLGGRYMELMIDNFDTKKGRQHNFDSIVSLLEEFQTFGMIKDWLIEWSKGLIFDALIGNTDRHQNNWGILFYSNGEAELSPWFDNGTSLGHERHETHVNNWDNKELDDYLHKGKHHLRWDLKEDSKRVGFFEMPKRLLTLDKSLKKPMLECVERLDTVKLRAFLESLTQLTYTPLESWRIDFICRITKRRQELLLESLLS